MRRKQIELGTVRVRGVHDRRPVGQAARAREELDRPTAVLGQALLDLLRLLVRVDVQWQLLRDGVPPDLLEPVGRAGAHGVGREPDAEARGAQRLDLSEVVAHRALAKAVEAASCVGDVEEHELDLGRSRQPRRLHEPSGTPR